MTMMQLHSETYEAMDWPVMLLIQRASGLQLYAFTQLHQDEALWTVLQNLPPVDATPGAQPQLTFDKLTERTARNEAKGFWEGMLDSMEQVRGARCVLDGQL
jgi:hypothetical protein